MPPSPEVFMKKRLISCLALLLVLITLLCSCTAGLPGHELVTALKNGVGSFSSNLKNLLADNTPILLNGESRFTVIYSVRESDTVRGAINSFCEAVEEKTGLALPTNKTLGVTRRILIGNTGEPASTQALKELNQASFYIGFSGDDLVVQAKNELMLISALAYLESTYLTGKDANAGDGYFYLPADLSFTAPTLTIRKEDVKDYTVVYSENASVWEREYLIPDFHKSITDVSDLSLGFKSDLIEIKDEENVKEILIGAPNRKQAKAILSELGFDEYYIGKQGNKLMILAHNSYMLETALTLFRNTFLQPDALTVDKTSKILTLPDILSYRNGQDHLALAEGGKANAVLVYADTLGPVALDAIADFADYFEKLTDAKLPVVAESEREENSDDAIEILVGPTRRRASEELTRKMSLGDWQLCVSEGRILAAGLGDNSTLTALNTLSNSLLGWLDLFTDEEIYSWTNQGLVVIPYVERLLPVPADLHVSGVAAPDLAPLTARVELTNGSYALYREDATELSFNNYISTLRRLGYRELQQSENGMLSTMQFIGDSLRVTVSFAADTAVLRVIADPFSLSAPNTQASLSLSGRNNVEPFYAQLLGESTTIYSNADRGLCTVLRLRDGSFIIINGGNGTKNHAAELLNFLKAQNVLPGKPVIACWIFIDGRADSVQTFREFSKHYASEVTLYSVMHNFPTQEQTLLHGGNSVNNAQNAMASCIKRFGNGVRVYAARTGVNHVFAGCKIEPLLTLEDFPAGYALENYSDCSLVFRITLADKAGSSKSFMMLGNVSRTGAELMLARYSNTLRADAVQVPIVSGHTSKSATQALYDAIAAPVVFWPVAYQHPTKGTPLYANAAWDPIVRGMLQQEYAKSCFVACRGTVILSLAELDAAAAGEPKAPGLTAADAAVGTTIE